MTTFPAGRVWHREPFMSRAVTSQRAVTTVPGATVGVFSVHRSARLHVETHDAASPEGIPVGRVGCGFMATRAWPCSATLWELSLDSSWPEGQWDPSLHRSALSIPWGNARHAHKTSSGSVAREKELNKNQAVLSPFYRYGHQGLQSLSNLCKVTR